MMSGKSDSGAVGRRAGTGGPKADVINVVCKEVCELVSGADSTQQVVVCDQEWS